MVHSRTANARQTPSIPRKGTETQTVQAIAKELIFCQTPSIPRKGTETHAVNQRRRLLLIGQTPSIPRKGTETAEKKCQQTS